MNSPNFLVQAAIDDLERPSFFASWRKCGTRRCGNPSYSYRPYGAAKIHNRMSCLEMSPSMDAVIDVEA